MVVFLCARETFVARQPRSEYFIILRLSVKLLPVHSGVPRIFSLQCNPYLSKVWRLDGYKCLRFDLLSLFFELSMTCMKCVSTHLSLHGHADAFTQTKMALNSAISSSTLARHSSTLCPIRFRDLVSCPQSPCRVSIDNARCTFLPNVPRTKRRRAAEQCYDRHARAEC